LGLVPLGITRSDTPPSTEPVTVASGITLRDFSQMLGTPMAQIIKLLMEIGT